MSEWQPIETAPKDGTCIIISGDSQLTIGWWHEDKGENLVSGEWEKYDFSYWDRCEIGDWFNVTHWMQLPSPPKAE